MIQKRTKEDLVGKRFGWIVVLNLYGSRKIDEKHSERLWTCLCDCGNETNAATSHLINGSIISCGCWRSSSEGIGSVFRTHGHTSYGDTSTTYKCWAGMKGRCYTTSNTSYGRYGALGITVCDRWLESFENFLKDMGEKPSGLTLDRIDSSKGYYKENCRWATPTEQSNNRKNNIRIERYGQSKTLKEWCTELGMPYKIVHQRIFRDGFTIENALTIPIKKNTNG
jgi:hypothetical protein